MRMNLRERLKRRIGMDGRSFFNPEHIGRIISEDTSPANINGITADVAYVDEAMPLDRDAIIRAVASLREMRLRYNTGEELPWDRKKRLNKERMERYGF